MTTVKTIPVMQTWIQQKSVEDNSRSISRQRWPKSTIAIQRYIQNSCRATHVVKKPGRFPANASVKKANSKDKLAVKPWGLVEKTALKRILQSEITPKANQDTIEEELSNTADSNDPLDTKGECIEDLNVSTVPVETVKVEKPHSQPQGTTQCDVDKSSAEIETSLRTSKIDWSKPVFFKVKDSSPIRLWKRPRLLFSLDVIQSTITAGQFQLASLMVCVDRFYRQSPSILEELLSLEADVPRKVESPKTPKSATEAKTPSTPEIPNLPQLEPQTPELDDPETEKLRSEIEEIVRRTPILQDHSKLFERVMPIIQSTSLFSRLTNSDSKKKPIMPDKAEDNIERGSKYLYAIVTPKKRLRELLQAESAVSPVRRSQRLMSKRDSKDGRAQLFEDVEDIPETMKVGFIPNPTVQLNARTSLLSTPKKSKKDPSNHNDNQNQ